ncbi:MAG: NAD(P)H-dependent oxidoreductase [Planctomycetes bacterium]|nr:NAD(P)H-dependent oxidoreductase [Planctomycetota bacterium]
MSIHVLSVCGSSSKDSRTRRILEIAAAGARAAGAEIDFLDLRETALPIMDPDSATQKADPTVKRVLETAAWAQGFLIATPEYHGNLSGALKNWFDFLYPELAGKVAGVVASTGGGGGEMSIVSAKNSFNWCHGFTLPFHVAARGADWEGETLRDEKIVDRLGRLGRDVVRYTQAIAPAWEAAKKEGKGPESGFAGFHT